MSMAQRAFTGEQRPVFDEIQARENGLERSLSSGQLSMIAIGGAIGTGLFLGSRFAMNLAGPAVLVSYTIGAVIALLLMGCLAEMTVAHPTVGSFGSYAEFYINPMVGFLVRYIYWFAVVGAAGTEVTAVAIYMKFWFPNLPGWIWMIGLSLALVAVNTRNVRVFGRVEYVFSLMKILMIVAFIVLGSALVLLAPSGSPVTFRNYTSHGGFFPHGLSGAWVAGIVAIFSYLSIEMIAVAAGEAQQPERAVRNAFRSTVFRLVVFYLLSLALMLAIVPWNAGGATQSPFVTVMQAAHIPGAAGVVNFVILIAAVSAMNSQLYITSRMLFSLSRSGSAPLWLGQLTRRGVPLSALLLSTIGIAAATVLYLLYPDIAFLLMLAISSFGGIFTWLMIFVTHLFFRRAINNQVLSFRMWGFPYGTLAGVGLIAALLITTLFTPEFRMTMICGVPLLALLAGIYLFRRHRYD